MLTIRWLPTPPWSYNIVTLYGADTLSPLVACAVQAVNRLRAWAELKRTTFFFLQKGQANVVASLGHLTDAVEITHSGAPARARESAAKVMFREQKQRSENDEQWVRFFEEVGVQCDERDDGPWGDNDWWGEVVAWTMGSSLAEHVPSIDTTARSPDSCLNSMLDSNKALSRSITGLLLRGQGEDASIGESLHKVDDGDIISARLQYAYLSLSTLNPGVPLKNLFEVNPRLCMLNAGNQRAEAARSQDTFVAMMEYIKHKTNQGQNEYQRLGAPAQIKAHFLHDVLAAVCETGGETGEELLPWTMPAASPRSSWTPKLKKVMAEFSHVQHYSGVTTVVNAKQAWTTLVGHGNSPPDADGKDSASSYSFMRQIWKSSTLGGQYDVYEVVQLEEGGGESSEDDGVAGQRIKRQRLEVDRWVEKVEKKGRKGKASSRSYNLDVMGGFKAALALAAFGRPAFVPPRAWAQYWQEAQAALQVYVGEGKKEKKLHPICIDNTTNRYATYYVAR